MAQFLKVAHFLYKEDTRAWFATIAKYSASKKDDHMGCMRYFFSHPNTESIWQ